MDRAVDDEPERHPTCAMLGQLIAHLPDPTLVVDRDLQVVAANDLAAALLGSEIATLRGSAVTQIVPPERSDAFRALVADQRREPGHVRFDAAATTIRRMDGTDIHVDLSIRAIETEDGWRWIGTLHDAQDRVDAEQRLAAREQILLAVAHASDRLLRGEDWETDVQDVLARLGEAAAVSRVYVYEAAEAPDDVIVRQRFEWVARGVEPLIDSPRLRAAPLAASGFGRWIDVLRRGDTIHGDVASLPDRERAVQASHGVQALVVVPIMVNGGWWGFIGFDECHRERTWSVAEIQALHSAADVIGASIERSATMNALTRSRELYAIAYQRERDASTRLRQLDDLKERFLEAMSHELRTPLAAIIGFSETLQRLDPAEDPEQTHLLVDRLRRNADRLDRLLGDLIDVGQLTHRGLDVVPAHTDIAAVVALACEDARSGLGDRVVQTDIQVEQAFVDPAKLRRIVTCLLRNVGRHTPERTRAIVAVRQADDRLIEVIVEDDGPGIADADKDAVFEPFVQGPAVARHAPGTGLGLALVARLARLHGGDVDVEDVTGGGTRIRVRLATGAALRPATA